MKLGETVYCTLGWRVLDNQKATHSLTSMVFLSIVVDAMFGRTMIPNCSRTHYSGFGGDTSKRKCLLVDSTSGKQESKHAQNVRLKKIHLRSAIIQLVDSML